MWRPLPSAVARCEAPPAGKAGGAAEGSGTHKVDGGKCYAFGFGNGNSSRVGPNMPAGFPPDWRIIIVSWPR